MIENRVVGHRSTLRSTSPQVIKNRVVGHRSALRSTARSIVRRTKSNWTSVHLGLTIVSVGDQEKGLWGIGPPLDQQPVILGLLIVTSIHILCLRAIASCVGHAIYNKVLLSILAIFALHMWFELLPFQNIKLH